MVVDTEQTGKKLLQHGELRRRYTIIPLNKISARSIPGDVVHRAEDLVRTDCQAGNKLSTRACRFLKNIASRSHHHLLFVASEHNSGLNILK